MKLSSKVYDSLADPHHGYLFLTNLKHTYFGISLHPKDRYVFLFTIYGKGQLQSTRMSQKLQSAGFTINEFVYQGFGALNKSHNEFFLQESVLPDRLATLIFYDNNFFGGFPNFKS